MKCIRQFLICTLASAALCTQVRAIKIHERTLPNGLKVVVAPDPFLRLSSVDVWVRAGTALEYENEKGSAHFLEHVLFKGTTTRGAGQMDLAIENVGASLNAATSKDWAHFYTTVATEYISTALELLSDALENPAFSPSEVARESQVISIEVANRRSEPMQLLDDTLADNLFGKHPYARPVYGTIDQIRALTPASLRSFHKRCYVAGAMTVVVVGNVAPEDIFKKVEARFGSIKGPEAVKWPEPAVRPSQATTVDLPKALGNQEWLSVGFIGPGVDSPEDVWATDILCSVLARSNAGVLQDRLVVTDKSGLGVDTTFLTQHLPAMIGIKTAVLPGKIEACQQAIAQEIAKIHLNGPTEGELDAAKRYLLGTYAFEVETAEGQAGSLGFYSIISDVKDSVAYAANVRNVKASDVQRVAKKYLDLDKSVVVRMIK